LGHHRLRSRAATQPAKPAIATRRVAGARRESRASRSAVSSAGFRRTRLMSASFNPPNMSGFQRRALIAGIVLILAMLLPLNHDRFFEAYLIGWTFWTGIAVGSLALLMLQHLTSGGWGFVIRRILEASTRTLPFMAVLFIPI